MSFFKRLFGQHEAPSPRDERSLTRATPRDPATDPNMVRVYDAHGRELFIARDEWLQNVLLGNLEKSKDNPDTLATMLTGALRDGFAKEVASYAEHLHRTDTQPARGATLLSIVYLKSDRLDDAERVLRDFLDRHGENAYVLTNLAKVQHARGDAPTAEATLWHALELDPNQDNALSWYLAIHRDRGGGTAYEAACRRVAGLPGSWRPQLWLGREALQRKDLPAALSLYEESLSRAGQPAPSDLLMQMSGDLGNAGHVNEIIALIAPRFDAAQHGLEVGNNLIKANLDLVRVSAIVNTEIAAS